MTVRAAGKCGGLPLRRSAFLQYLPVDGSDDGRAQPHARHEAHVEVPLQDERLHARAHEEQRGVEVALPGGGIGVIDKQDQQPVRGKWEKENDDKNNLRSYRHVLHIQLVLNPFGTDRRRPAQRL